LIDAIPVRFLGGHHVWVDIRPAGQLLLAVRDHGARDLLIHGRISHEQAETVMMESLFLRTSSAGFLDVGASYGWYTMLAVQRLPPNTKKVCVEAHPGVYRCLEQSVARVGNVRALHAAASAVAGTIGFFSAPSSNLSSVVRAVGRAITVPAIPLDDIWSESDGPLGIVKCDVEGGELAVLQGARSLRDRWQPIWLMEVSEQMIHESGKTIRDVEVELGLVEFWWHAGGAGWRRSETLSGALEATDRNLNNLFIVPPSRTQQFEAALVAPKAR
jgi:FkbM family methyltransferase